MEKWDGEDAGQGATSDELRVLDLRSNIAGLKSVTRGAIGVIFQLSKIGCLNGEQEPVSS